MTKDEFISCLSQRLSGLTVTERNDRLRFYSEMIDDRMEEGMSEEEAVSAVGSIDAIVAQILAEASVNSRTEASGNPGRRIPWGIILLLVLGSPVWLSLLISVFAVVFSLWVSLWAAVISLWAVVVSVVLCGLLLTLAGIGILFKSFPLGLAMIGVGLLCAGLSIFLFFGFKWITIGAAKLTQIFGKLILRCFRGRGKKHV